MVIAMLRQIAELRGQPDVYHVHHGSISAALRESAETDMKESTGPVVIAATLTLEMGIDVGRLESIFQINAPNSVSSFLQRLGRSGRRGSASEMWFLCSEQLPSGVPLPPQQLPWRLLQTIAVLQLYLEERWVESPLMMKYPLSLLYHQTMSIVASYGEITPEALAKKVLGMESFSYISQEDYQLLLSHLLEIGHLQHIEDGGLIIGLEGEKLTNNFKFLAVFADDENEYIIIIKPHFLYYILKNNFSVHYLLYAGNNIYFYKSPAYLLKKYENGSIFLYRLPKTNEKSNSSFKTDLIGFRRDKNTLNCLMSWKDRNVEWSPEDGYINTWPSCMNGVRVLENKFVNAEPQNTIYYRIVNNKLIYICIRIISVFNNIFFCIRKC
jgi:hypothetical protein